MSKSNSSNNKTKTRNPFLDFGVSGNKADEENEEEKNLSSGDDSTPDEEEAKIQDSITRGRADFTTDEEYEQYVLKKASTFYKKLADKTTSGAAAPSVAIVKSSIKVSKFATKTDVVLNHNKLEIAQRQAQEALALEQPVITKHLVDGRWEMLLSTAFEAHTKVMPRNTYTNTDLFALPVEEFFKAVLNMYPSTAGPHDGNGRSNALETLVNEVVRKSFHPGMTINTVATLQNLVYETLDKEGGLTEPSQIERLYDGEGSKTLIATVKETLRKKNGVEKPLFSTVLKELEAEAESRGSDEPQTFRQFCVSLQTIYDGIARKIFHLRDIGVSPEVYSAFAKTNKEHNQQNPDTAVNKTAKKQNASNKQLNALKTTGGIEPPNKKFKTEDKCDGCGRNHEGGRKACRLAMHPDFNKTGRFAQSETYRRLQLISEKLTFIPSADKKLEELSNGKYKLGWINKTKVSESNQILDKHTHINLSYLYNLNRENNYVQGEVQGHNFTTLLDTGALQDNYISSRLINILKLKVYDVPCVTYVHSVHGEEIINNYVKFPIQLTSYRQGIVKVKLPEIKFLVLKEGPTDITIGLQDIRKYNITETLKAFFTPDPAKGEQREETGQRSVSTLAQLFPAQTYATVAKEALLDPVANTDPIEELVTEDSWSKYFDQSQEDASNPKPLTKFNVHGTEEDQKALLVFLNNNIDIFAEEVKSTPAKLPAFMMSVDEKAWHADKKSREYTRPQSKEREVAINKFITKAIADNVIKPSSAPAWSQILLTKKPNGKWRFCLDYRTLNKYTKTRGWPIPNIGQVLESIGSHKPKMFAVMDLTSGFHQCPMDEASQDYTTFTSSEGNYKWTRPPMGLRNVPPYFQQMMANNVFPSLLHKIIEIYIDDLITWSQNVQELIKNLTKIFHLLREFGLVLNPEKCHFGMSEVEYVGHLINEVGITFSKEKLQSIENFVQPYTMGELKSFVGLGSYFRDHIPNYSTLVHPLSAMLEGYQKKFRKRHLVWTTETSQCFEAVKTAIANCQQLFFRNHDAPIRVYTDASDYGIGAYLCQVVEGMEQPIGFLSKTLTKTEKRWSVYEKEAYAIFYALRKWEHHLRDNKFTLYTDHRNLTFINKDPSPKVQRWKIAVQEYDFDIAYIEGENNEVADPLSRFCPRNLSDEEEEAIMNSLTLEDIKAQFPPGTSRDLYFLNTMPKTRVQYHVRKENLHTFNTLITELHSLATDKLPHIPERFHKIIARCHNSIVGHFGQQTTLQKIEEFLRNNPEEGALEWKTKREDIATFIKKCPCCQKMRQMKLEMHTDKYTTSTYGIFENISMDVIYMPNTTQGYKYILTIIDSFTRYTEVYPIKELTAKAAFDCLLHWMNTYGIPNNICTDNSSQFQSIFEETLKLLQINNYKIHPYSHQENSIVERANKEIQRHLRNLVFQEKIIDQWYTLLPLVKRILNSKIHTSTGVAPVDIVFAGQVDLNKGILFDSTTLGGNEITMSEYLQNIYSYQDTLLKKAYEMQEETDILHMATASVKSKTEFPLLSYVLIKPETGPDNKLAPRLKGPYQILNKTSRKQGDVYTCQHLASNKIEDFHVTIMTPFIMDESTNPLEIAAHDHEYHIVESVLQHKFKGKNNDKTKNLLLKIKWVGENLPEWVPYDNSTLKKVELVHDYLYANRLAKHVPAAFKRVVESPSIVEETRKRVYFENSNEIDDNSHTYSTRYKRGKTTKLMSY